MRFPLALILLALLSAGCAVLAGEQPTPTPLPSGAILFADDFSKSTGWGMSKQAGGEAEYSSAGWLRIRVSKPQTDYWSVAGKNFRDVQIDVDAAKLNGPDNNLFGVLCRYVDKENFYMLLISSDGYYGIARLKGGQYSMIGADQLQYSGAIARGVARNHLQVGCAGSKLSLFANGQKLEEAQDAEFSSGDVGLLAGAYQVEGVDIVFDNFVVKKP